MSLELFVPPYSIHLGCNTMRLRGFVNVDARETEITDVVHDCKDLSVFPDGSARMVFSHAFFEHVYQNDRIPLLRDVRRVLIDGGIVHFCGLPDFEIVAQKYFADRKRLPDSHSPLMQVYAATHGMPEGKPEWWLAQLHKSLFDLPTLREILRLSGLDSFVIYRYAYGDEEFPVNLGFVAKKGDVPVTIEEAKAVITRFAVINKVTKADILEKAIVRQ